MVPLIHHWLIIQGQRSMRGLRMNTLGWFDFKSAWFAPPDPIDWQADAARWRNGEMNLANWCQQLVASKAMVPLIHHWLIIQGQRSMSGLRMNTLGWFDFKSAWFAPPDP